MARFRTKRNKRTNNHHDIEGLDAFLDEVAEVDTVQTVVGGRLRASGSARRSGLLRIRYQRTTISGLKLVARRGGLWQDVFVTTSQPEKTLQQIQHLIDE